jgi:cytochrome bd-type quinol oxidase subunit 2
MLRVKRILLTLVASFGLLLPLAVPSLASAADIETSLCQGANLQIGDDNCDVDQESAQSTVNNVITWVINVFSFIVGVVAVIMLIVGGLKYITSGGDSGNVTGAKNTILYAIIGLIIVALAQIVVRFILGKTNEAITSSPGS